MYCCEKKYNICYFFISIILFVILLILYVTLTGIVLNDNPAHINSFNYAPENVKDREYITFDTNRVIEKNDLILLFMNHHQQEKKQHYQFI